MVGSRAIHAVDRHCDRAAGDGIAGCRKDCGSRDRGCTPVGGHVFQGDGRVGTKRGERVQTIDSDSIIPAAAADNYTDLVARAVHRRGPVQTGLRGRRGDDHIATHIAIPFVEPPGAVRLIVVDDHIIEGAVLVPEREFSIINTSALEFSDIAHQRARNAHFARRCIFFNGDGARTNPQAGFKRAVRADIRCNASLPA